MARNRDDKIDESLTLEELFIMFWKQFKTEISEDIFNRVVPLIQSLQQPPKQETVLVPRKKAAKMFGISLPTLHDWTMNGKITGHRIGSRIYYKLSELESSLSQIKTQ